MKIGVLNDEAGSFADASGPGSVVAARLAALVDAVNPGARVLGPRRHALGTTDVSSLLLQAQASGAKVAARGRSDAPSRRWRRHPPSRRSGP